MLKAEKTNTRIRPHSFPQIDLGKNGLPVQMDKGQGIFHQLRLNSISHGGKNNANYLDEIENSEELKIKDIEAKAYKKGYETGLNEGQKNIADKVTNIINLLKSAIEQTRKFENQITQSAEKETVKLAIAIAKKIIISEVMINEKVILNVVKNSLKLVMNQDRYLIKINPADLGIMQNAQPELSELVENYEDIVFESDESIEQGGCLIETNYGNIDGRLEQQMQVISDLMNEEIQKRR